MKATMLVFLSVLSSLGARAAEEALPTSFDKPVTLAVKGEALSDIVAVLSKQTGVKLRATRDIADQKATIFVDKCPLKAIIVGLKTIFGYRFSVVEIGNTKVYELSESTQAKRERETMVEGLMGAAYKEADRRIREVAGLSAEEQAKSKDELDPLISKSRAGTRLTADERKRYAELEAKVGPAAPLAKIYAGLPPQIVFALQSGCTAYFDSDTTESEWRLGQNTLEEIAARGPDQVSQWDGIPDGGCNVSLGFRTEGSQLIADFAAKGYWTGSNGGRKMVIQDGGSPGGAVTIDKVIPQSSETKLPSVPDNGQLDKQITFTPKERADEADLYGQTETSSPIFVNRSDILSLLHKKLGLQLISDHHSCWSALNAGHPQTVKELLGRLSGDQKAAEGNPKSDPVWGWNGSMLLMRERFPYELDVLESPNRVIRRCRTNLAQNRYLGLDHVAELATLSMDQAQALIRNWQHLIYVRGVDYSTSEAQNQGAQFDPAVRFYSRLSDLQKSGVKTNGLQVTGLTQDQLGMLAKCVPPSASKSQETIRRVGIWYEDTRLDKPQSDGTMPAQVKLVKRDSQVYDLRVPVSQGYVEHQVTALSPAEAQKQYLQDMPEVKTKSHFFGREMGYSMVFVFPDGTTKEHPIELYAPVRIDKEGK